MSGRRANVSPRTCTWSSGPAWTWACAVCSWGTGSPLPGFDERAAERLQSEHDQHDRDGEFEPGRHPLWDARAQDHESTAEGHHAYQRVPRPPCSRVGRRRPCRPSLGDQRRHRSEVVRFERVPHALRESPQ